MLQRSNLGFTVSLDMWWWHPWSIGRYTPEGNLIIKGGEFSNQLPTAYNKVEVCE